MLDQFLQRQLRRIEALEAAHDALPPADSEIVIERRLRIVAGFYRAMKLAIQIGEIGRKAARPQEDQEDDMGLRRDPETLERKHRLLDAGLARLRRHLDREGAPLAADPKGTGGRASELAGERQPRAA